MPTELCSKKTKHSANEPQKAIVDLFDRYFMTGSKFWFTSADQGRSPTASARWEASPARFSALPDPWEGSRKEMMRQSRKSA